jgi:sugar phosphate permease
MRMMFYGWYIVGACVFITMYLSGTVYMGFTTIFDPIANEMGWSYTQISLASSLRGFEVGLLVPIAGMIMDRWGPRKLVFGGLVVTGVGMIMLSRVQTLLMFYTAFGLVCVGASTMPAPLLTATVANWFHKHRGLAMGITSSGVSLGGILIPVMTALVDTYGWRQAMIMAGVGIWTIPLFLSLLLRHKPEPYGFLPYGTFSGDRELENPDLRENSSSPGVRVIDALRLPAFWIISVAILCHVMAVNAIMTHIMPFFSHIGVGRDHSGLIIGAIPLIGVVGRIGFGWLMDRIDKIKAATLALVLTSLGVIFFIFVTADRPVFIILFILCFGIGWGGIVPMLSGLVILFFGRHRMATITGCVGSVMMVGILAGAPLAGWTFDVYGSYRAAWCVMGLLLSSVTFVFYFFLCRFNRNTRCI